MQKRIAPSFFLIRTIGLLQREDDGEMIPLTNIFVTAELASVMGKCLAGCFIWGKSPVLIR